LVIPVFFNLLFISKLDRLIINKKQIFYNFSLLFYVIYTTSLLISFILSLFKFNSNITIYIAVIGFISLFINDFITLMIVCYLIYLIKEKINNNKIVKNILHYSLTYIINVISILVGISLFLIYPVNMNLNNFMTNYLPYLFDYIFYTIVILLLIKKGNKIKQ